MGHESLVMVRVDGVWGYSDGQVIADVFDQKIHWPSGQKTDLIRDGHGGFEVSLRGVKHTAELMPDMCIKWSNGDIWTQLSSFGEQPNPVRTSPKFSEQNRNHPIPFPAPKPINSCDDCPECTRKTQPVESSPHTAPRPTNSCTDCPECNRKAQPVESSHTHVAPRPTNSCNDCPECNRKAQPVESSHTHVAPRPINSCNDCPECTRKTQPVDIKFASPPMQLRALPPPEEHVNFGQYQSYPVEHEVRYDLPPVRKIVHHLPEAHIVEHCYEPDCTANGDGEHEFSASQPRNHGVARQVQHVNHQAQYHEKSYSDLNHETRHDLPPLKTVLHHLPQHHEYEHCYDHIRRYSPDTHQCI